MPEGCDKYLLMTDLYNDPLNIQGETYGKRWLRHQWGQAVEGKATDSPETQKIILALHGGGIESGTSEIALATAGFHPATLSPITDGFGTHDYWLFEGLLPSKNGELHVTASHYDEPIATELVRNARRCISLHGCRDEQADGKIQLGGLDLELRDIILEELQRLGIAAEIARNPMINGSDHRNIANKTMISGCAQLEMSTSFRKGLFGTNTRAQRKNTTNDQFDALVLALRKALDRVQ